LLLLRCHIFESVVLSSLLLQCLNRYYFQLPFLGEPALLHLHYHIYWSGLPFSDPYRSWVENQPQISVIVRFLTIRPNGQYVRSVEEIDVALKSQLALASVPTSRVVASFVGRVESLVGDSALVLLINQATGEQLDSRCDAVVLRENGIGDGDEFRFEVHRSKEVTSTRLFRLPPKTLSREQVDQIRAAFKNRWTF